MNKLGIYIVYNLIIIGIILSISAGIKSTYQFEPEEVRPQLERVLGTSEYEILDSSNNSVWVGTPGEVTYNIRLKDSSVVSCKCTDGVFQPRICRKYQ